MCDTNPYVGWLNEGMHEALTRVLRSNPTDSTATDGSPTCRHPSLESL
jgi:hypothetical protein